MRFLFYSGFQVLLGVAFLVAPSWAQFGQRGSQTQSGEINVNADKMGFGDGGSQIEASGNVEVKRQQTTIKADEVRMNRTTQEVEAKGKVSIDDPEWKVKSADAMKMNMGDETGEIQKGDIFVEEGHISISGQRLQKFTGQSYHIDEGFFTTCLCESGTPSWRVFAETMDLNLEGSGTIRNGYFYVLDVPVFYLPFGSFPLRTERQTGFLFPKFGQSTKDGFRLQVPFFWAISKSTDATFAADYESKSRVGFLGEVRTMFDRDSDFQLHGSYFNESLRGNATKDIVDTTIAVPRIPVDRWSTNGTHRYRTGAGWQTYSDIAAYSDDLFTRELIERFDFPGTRESDLRRSRYSESRFGSFRGWSDTFVNGEWSFFQDFIQYDKNTLQRTPQIAYWGRRFLADFPLEIRWRAEAVNYLRRDGGPINCGLASSPAQRTMCGDGMRFDWRPEAVLPFSAGSYLFGSLSAAPRGTFYHLYTTVKSSDHNVARPAVELRGNIATSLGRIFAVDSFGLSGIKHVFEPAVSYLFVPQPDQSRIPIMDSTDRINRRNLVTFSVTNRLWGKAASQLATAAAEKDVELLNPIAGGAVRDLGSLKVALSYDIDRERKGGDTLSDLDITLRTTSLGIFTLLFDGGVNPGAWQMTRARASVGVSDPRPLARRSLDPDFNRPSSANISYYFFRRGPNGFLAEDANINLDAPFVAGPGPGPGPTCKAHPDDPRCPTAFNDNVASNLGGNLFYHATDRLLLSFNASYNFEKNNFPGFRTAAKVLSECECWSFTLTLKKEINPAKTSFNFDFNLLGLGTQRSTMR